MRHGRASHLKMARAYLIARLSAQESFDLAHVSPALEAGRKKFAHFPLGREIARFSRWKDVSLLSPSTLDRLEAYERDNEILIYEHFIYELDSFARLCKALTDRHPELAVFAVVDSPLKFYNDYAVRPVAQTTRSAYAETFFRNGLYRVDRALAAIAQATGKEPHILCSADPAENERKFLELAGADSCGYHGDFPTPASHAAKDVNRFYGLPKFRELVPFRDWRGIVSQFETGLTRIAPPESFNELSALCARYWKYAMKRHPELEQIADFDPAPYMGAPLYTGFDAKKLASLLPGNFASHFGALRLGFPGFYQPVFNEFEKLELPHTGPRCTVVTFTYNHEKYIAECIESVAAQKGCDIEHLIFDDASKDATPEIISQFAAKYPHVKPVLFKRKPLTTIEPAFQSCRSEYVALCDGDDYFTDPEKLRKQIDMLSGRPELSVCSHYAKIVYEDGRPSQTFPDRKTIGDRRDFTLADILQGNFMQTCSVMYRWRFRDGLPSWFNTTLRPADWYWHVLHAEKGDIGFIPEEMAVYRRHTDSAYATADTNDPKRHFLKHGLRELEVFYELNRHFSGRYHKDFENLAVGVFARLYTHVIESDDDAPYQAAAKMFPGFAKNFLERLAEVSNRGKR